MEFFEHNERLCPECDAKSYNTGLIHIGNRRMLRPIAKYVEDEFIMSNHTMIKYDLLICARGHKWAVNLELNVGAFEHPVYGL